MELVVSRLRTRRTKDRDKKSAKPSLAGVSTKDHYALRLGIGLAFWAATVLLLGIERFLSGPVDLDFIFGILGKATLLLVCLFAAALGLSLIRSDLMRRTGSILMLALIALAALLPVKLILYAGLHLQTLPPDVIPFLFPLAMAPILATLLLDGAAGVAVGVWTSVSVCLIADAGLPLFLSGLAATTVSAAVVHRARTRATVIRSGIVAGLAELMCVVGLTAINAADADVMHILWQAGACIVSGFASAVLALLVLPVLESLFHRTSDITLLELTDLGHPLLQRLALEAPGTYHHSLVVANLAQAAADEIDANALLARVCAYFHDIGKICKPEFFTENIRADRNPHDKLPPSMSTLLITAHVKEGVSLATLYKLPQAVLRVICEHHGTSLVSYFHGKAKAQLEFETSIGVQPAERPDVEEWNYRYPGPKPSTPESAIISLADPVEAASRSIEKITHAHIRDVVDRIVNSRLEDGQLDDSKLTLDELARIKKTFVATLMNMLHARTRYPKDEDHDMPPTRGATGASPDPATADRLAHG